MRSDEQIDEKEFTDFLRIHAKEITLVTKNTTKTTTARMAS